MIKLISNEILHSNCGALGSRTPCMCQQKVLPLSDLNFPSICSVQHFIYIHINKVTSSLHLSTGFNIFIGLADAVLLGAADLIHHRIFINFTMHNQS